MTHLSFDRGAEMQNMIRNDERVIALRSCNISSLGEGDSSEQALKFQQMKSTFLSSSSYVRFFHSFDNGTQDAPEMAFIGYLGNVFFYYDPPFDQGFFNALEHCIGMIVVVDDLRTNRPAGSEYSPTYDDALEIVLNDKFVHLAQVAKLLYTAIAKTKTKETKGCISTALNLIRSVFEA